MRIRCIDGDGCQYIRAGHWYELVKIHREGYTILTKLGPWYYVARRFDVNKAELRNWKYGVDKAYAERNKELASVSEELAAKTLAEGKNNTVNPKQAFGSKKPRLTLNPLTAQIAQQEAHLDGALKYGEVNWRETKVDAKTYIDAALRHLHLYANGEENARDTSVRNLGGVMACCAILIDAAAHGMLVDNRDHSPASCDALHDGERMVAHLKEMQKARDEAKK